MDAINKNVSVTGPGRDVLTISRNTAQNTPQFRIFEISAGNTVVISGLTLANGRTSGAAGIYNLGELTLRDARIRDCNSLDDAGGALWNSGPRLTVSNSIITNNRNTWYAGGIFSQSGTLRIDERTEITANNARFGGGIYVRGGTVDIVNSTIRGNNSTQRGAGIDVEQPVNTRITVNIERTDIDNNTVAAGQGIAQHFGGGMFVSGALVNLGDQVRIRNNTATFGGGIYVTDGEIRNVAGAVTIDNNTARQNGGGINMQSAQVRFANLTVTNNTATSGRGGAIFAFGTAGLPSSLRIDEGTANNNRSARGGAGAIEGNVRGWLFALTIAGNTATDDAQEGLAGGIFVGDGATVELVNCIIAGNTDDEGSPDVYGDFTSLGHNLIGDTTGSTGWDQYDDILNEDPLLGDLGYHGGTTQTMLLLEGSPAIDVWEDSSAPSVDQRGYTRVVNTNIDIGAVEMQTGEFDLTSPYAYNVDFHISLASSFSVDGTDDTPTLLDYSGNSGNEEIFVSAVNGSGANVEEEIETYLGGLVTVHEDGTFDYTAPDDAIGQDYFTVTYSDGTNTRTGTVYINVTDITAFDADYSTLKNDTLNVSADPAGLLHYAFAASGDSLSVSKVNGSSGNVGTNVSITGGTVNITSAGAITFTPTTDFTGDASVTVEITDGLDATTITVNFHVVQVLAEDAEYTVVHDHELEIPDMIQQGLLSHAEEADDEELTVVAINGDEEAIDEEVTTAMGGTIVVSADGSFVYTPPAGFAGDDWVSYTVSNGTDESTAAVIIHVTNAAPTISSAPSYYMSANTTLSVPDMINWGLLTYADDADDDTLSIAGVIDDGEEWHDVDTAVETPHGTVTVQADGSFVYVPDTNFTGDDTFDVVYTDGITTVRVTVTIHVS